MTKILKFDLQYYGNGVMTPKVKAFEEVSLVQVDNPWDKQVKTIIAADTRCPARFQQHPIWPQFFCLGWEMQQPMDHPDILKLVAQWSLEIPDALLKNGKPVWDDDPLQRPLRVSMSYYDYDRPMRMGYDYKTKKYKVSKTIPVPDIPVMTTAGEPIAAMFSDQVRAYRCCKNMAKLPAFMSRGGKFINLDAVQFQGVKYEPYELMACNIELSDAKFEFGRVFYIMNFMLLVSPDSDGWAEKHRNSGFHEKDFYDAKDANGRPIKVPFLKEVYVGKPEDKQLPSSPVLLDPDGKAYRAPGFNQTMATPNKSRTGPVLSIESSGAAGIGITKQMWDDAELKFWPRLAIPFTTYIPLK